MRITALVERTGSPAVLLGHSMGNRTIQYFLNTVKAQPDGNTWLKKHVHTWVAVGAPLLGAPKAIRGMVLPFLVELYFMKQTM